MSQDLYCWRCDKVVPMLDEEEWVLVESALRGAISEIQSYRATHDVSLSEAMRQGYGQKALALYLELTGFSETNADALWHHRISDYGLPCVACGKPLRTPHASFCPACGARA